MVGPMDERLRTVERQAHDRGDADAWRDYATALARAGRREEALVAALHARGLDPRGAKHDLLSELDANYRDVVAELRHHGGDPERVRRLAVEQPLSVFGVLRLLSEGARADQDLARQVADVLLTAGGLVQTYLGFEHALAHEGLFSDFYAGCRIGSVAASAARVAAALATTQTATTLRGASLVDDSAAVALARRHPIAAAAPLELRPIEAAAPQILIDRPGWPSTRIAEFRPVARVAGQWDPVEVPRELVSEMTLFCEQNANSQADLWACRLAEAPPRITPETLVALDAECLRDVRELGLVPLTAEQLYNELLELFRLGSIYYGSGWFGAQARGLAWRTLSWLVGEWGRPVIEVERAAQRGDRVLFAALSPWFDRYEDRLGLAVLRPNGIIAVFAIVATD
jgi:hypothetical protein